MGVISMTGFGRGEATIDGVSASVEISTVNRKQLDCQVALPRYLSSLEARIQTTVRATLARGHAKVAVTVASEAAAAVEADLARWRQRIAVLRTAAAELDLPDDLTASTLVQLDGKADGEMRDLVPDAAWQAIDPALTTAVAALLAMRQREGAAIRADVQNRLCALRRLADEIVARAPEIPLTYRDTLRTRIEALLSDSGATLEADALAREVALFADRCDISEELTRLESHFAQAKTLLDGSAPCGRPLDFLCQEFFREINTIGAKANDATITRSVIAFKTGLETIREQVQNIE